MDNVKPDRIHLAIDFLEVLMATHYQRLLLHTQIGQIIGLSKIILSPKVSHVLDVGSSTRLLAFPRYLVNTYSFPGGSVGIRI
jgi:hypothetical protein